MGGILDWLGLGGGISARPTSGSGGMVQQADVSGGPATPKAMAPPDAAKNPQQAALSSAMMQMLMAQLMAPTPVPAAAPAGGPAIPRSSGGQAFQFTPLNAMAVAPRRSL